MKIPSRLIFALVLTVGLAASVQAQTRTITNKLVVHLTFDDTMNDDSGRANNATYAYAGSGSATPTYVAGKLGDAFKFTTLSGAPPSGVEYASLGYPDDLKFDTTNDFSVAFWVKHNGNECLNDMAYIANRDWNSSGNRGWGIFAQSGTNNFRVHYTVTEPSTVKYAYRPNIIVSDGVWHHVAVTYQRGGNVSTYFDGVLQNSTAFNPPEAGTNTMDTYALPTPLVVNIGQDGTGGYAGGIIANIDDVGFWRRVLTLTEVANIYNFAQLGTNLFNVPDVNTPILLSFTPNNGAAGVVPNIPTRALIQDQTTQMDTNSVRLLVDGVQVPHTLIKSGTSNTITYTSPFLFSPLSVHTNKLIFADNGTPIPTRSTNVSVYTVAAWTNLYLGTPLYVENFDELAAPTNPPAVYPAGWSVSNCTDVVGAPYGGTWSLFEPRSDAYQDWQIVPIGIIASSFNYDGNILNMNGTIVANGVAYGALGSNNIVFAASDQRSGNQVDYLFTKDYDLTGQTNVWVAFNSMYSQEDFQLGALEYSIDQGATWLPILYLLSSNPNCYVTNGAGVLDPAATMSATILQIPFGSCGYGNSYGVYIGVASDLWSTLAPYIRIGPRGDHVTNHKVEQFRLPQADGQSKVRFRFAMVGANYWDWGFDNFGIYTKASPPDLKVGIAQSGSSLTVNWSGSGANFSGLQKATSLSAPDWVDIVGTIGQTSYTAPASGTVTYYRAKKF